MKRDYSRKLVANVRAVNGDPEVGVYLDATAGDGPDLVTVYLSGRERSVWLRPSQARELGRALLAAADDAETR